MGKPTPLSRNVVVARADRDREGESNRDAGQIVIIREETKNNCRKAK